jgi:hypothetical protein
MVNPQCMLGNQLTMDSMIKTALPHIWKNRLLSDTDSFYLGMTLRGLEPLTN